MVVGRTFKLLPIRRKEGPKESDFSFAPANSPLCEGIWMLVNRAEWVSQCKSRWQLVRISDRRSDCPPAFCLRVGLHKSRNFLGLWTASGFHDTRPKVITNPMISERKRQRLLRAQQRQGARSCGRDVFVVVQAMDFHTHAETVFTVLERLATNAEDLDDLEQLARRSGLPTDMNRLIAHYAAPPMPVW
jgi:hypothetical protein